MTKKYKGFDNVTKLVNDLKNDGFKLLSHSNKKGRRRYRLKKSRSKKVMELIIDSSFVYVGVEGDNFSTVVNVSKPLRRETVTFDQVMKLFYKAPYGRKAYKKYINKRRK